MSQSRIAEQLVESFQKRNTDLCVKLVAEVSNIEHGKEALCKDLLRIPNESDFDMAVACVDLIRFTGCARIPGVIESLASIALSRFTECDLKTVSAEESRRRPGPSRKAAARFRFLQSLVRTIQKDVSPKTEEFLTILYKYFIRIEGKLHPSEI